MSKLIQSLGLSQTSKDSMEISLNSISLNSMRRLIFDESQPEKTMSSEKLPAFLLKKNIQKPTLNKYSSPTKLICKKPLQMLSSKSSTPNPLIKNCSIFDLKSRSYSSLECNPFLKENDCEDEILENQHKIKQPYEIITRETLANMIKNDEKNIVIIDCRYSFEFQGGHIKNAFNINNNPFKLIEMFFLKNKKPELNDSQCKTMENSEKSQQKNFENFDFSQENLDFFGNHDFLEKIQENQDFNEKNLDFFKERQESQKKTMISPTPTKDIIEKFSEIEIEFSRKNDLEDKKIIFHCEFSQCRGPKFYNLLRDFDREINSKEYPKLTYPDIFLLEGGYSVFSQEFPEFCEPKGGYRKMKDKSFAKEMMMEHIKSKKLLEFWRSNKENVKNLLVKENN